MPSKATAFAWLRSKPSFLVMYQAAREDFAEGVFDDLRTLMNTEPPKDATGRTDMGALRDKEVKIRTLQARPAAVVPLRLAHVPKPVRPPPPWE